jgi:hypothetical protein
MSQKMSERGLRPILLSYVQLRDSQIPIYESKAKSTTKIRRNMKGSAS